MLSWQPHKLWWHYLLLIVYHCICESKFYQYSHNRTKKNNVLLKINAMYSILVKCTVGPLYIWQWWCNTCYMIIYKGPKSQVTAIKNIGIINTNCTIYSLFKHLISDNDWWLFFSKCAFVLLCFIAESAYLPKCLFSFKQQICFKSLSPRS